MMLLAGLALFVVGLGLIPHLYFSAAVDQIAWFKSAFDEDTYFLLSTEGKVGGYRLVSSLLTNALFVLSGRSADLAEILMDVLLPALSAAAVFFLASQITTRLPARVLAALLLLFGQDLLSGSGPVWASAMLPWFRSLFGSWGATLVPSYETSYLTLFRSPEPQLSNAFLFTLIGLSVRVARAPNWPDAAKAGFLTILAPFAYVFLSIPALLLVSGLSVVLFFAGRGLLALGLAASVAGALALFGLDAALGSSDSGDLIFASRLPILTPAVIASAVLTVAFLIWCRRKRVWTASAWLALGLLAMPAILCNQQLVTGVMVSARDWERNANYPILIAGSFLALQHVAPAGKAFMRLALCSLAATSVAALLVLAQVWTYSAWVSQNLASILMARAVAAAASGAPAGTRLLLDQPGLSPLLAARRAGAGATRFVLDFNEIFTTRVPTLDQSGGRVPASAHESKLFEYWWRTGWTPEKVRRTLEAEAAQRSGYYSGFLFSLKDFWHPATDNRHVRQDDIKAMIPRIVERYASARDHLSDCRDPDVVVRLAGEGPAALASGPGLRNEPIGSSQMGSTTVYAYRQVCQPRS
jgi:hypothetical protein